MRGVLALLWTLFPCACKKATPIRLRSRQAPKVRRRMDSPCGKLRETKISASFVGSPSRAAIAAIPAHSCGASVSDADHCQYQSVIEQ